MWPPNVKETRTLGFITLLEWFTTTPQVQKQRWPSHISPGFSDIHSCQFLNRGFLEKNRDAVSLDLIKMVDGSTNRLLRQMFGPQLPNTDKKISMNRRVTITPRNSVRVREATFPHSSNTPTHHVVSVKVLLFPTFPAGPAWQHQTSGHAERPVPPVPGLAHENSLCLPALFHPVLQA